MTHQPPAQSTNEEHVHTVIKNAIINRALLPGALVRERVIAKTAAAAIPSVRAAVETLVREDWLTRSPDGKARVKPVTSQDILETAQLRLALEPMIVERVMPRLGRRQFQYLEALLAQHERLLGAPDATGQFLSVDKSFHLYLASLMENARLLAIMRSVMDVPLRLGPPMALADSDAAGCLRDHVTIVESLRRADCATAKDAIIAHIERCCDALLGRVRE